MRLTDKYECGYEIRTEPHNCGCGELQVPICEDQDVRNKLGQLEDIEDNLPAFNGLQHLFAVIDLQNASTPRRRGRFRSWLSAP